MSQQRTRVAIVGAGLAGLTLAVALDAFDKDQKFAIDIYEAAPELSEIGAGIVVWPRTIKMMEQLGVADTLVPFLDRLPDLVPRTVFEARKADEQKGHKILDIVQNGGSLPIHRGDLQRTLMEHLPLSDSNRPVNTPCALHLSHRLVDYTQSSSAGPITLRFSNDVVETCDILMGADGIKSTVRQLFLTRLPSPDKYTKYLEPVWSGTIAYRGLVAREDLEKIYPEHRALNLTRVLYVSKNKYSVVYPVSGGKQINVVATVYDKSKDGTTWNGPWNTDVSQRELLDTFSEWEEEFQALLKCIQHPTKWALHNLNHLDIFAKGRVFLMGDSAHAMVPHLGAGAGVGLEDAYILAALLAHPSTPRCPTIRDVNRIADVYNAIRVPRAVGMSDASIRQGHLYVFANPEYDNYKEGEGVLETHLHESFRAAERNWSWSSGDPDEDRRRAEGLLETYERAVL